MSIEIHSRPGSAGAILADNADTSYEGASEWYRAYGWHISTERAGDVCLQAVKYDSLDGTDDEAIAILRASDTSLTADEATAIVRKAREIRDVAEAVEAALEQAVEMYEIGDLDGVETALNEAHSLETDHGDTPASDALRAKLIDTDPL